MIVQYDVETKNKYVNALHIIINGVLKKLCIIFTFSYVSHNQAYQLI